jgi:hypothetical protein
MTTIQAKIDANLRQVRKDLDRIKRIHAGLCVRLIRIHPMRRRKIEAEVLPKYVEEYNLFMQHRILLENAKRWLAN